MLIKFSKYGLVAAGSALSDWCTFTVMVFLGVNPVASQVVSRIVGGVFSFFTNKYWSFSTGKGHITIQGRRFMLLYGVSYSFAIGLFVFFSKKLGIQIFVAKLAVDVILFLFNYVVMHSYVFRDRKGLTHLLRKLLRPS